MSVGLFVCKRRAALVMRQSLACALLLSLSRSRCVLLQRIPLTRAFFKCLFYGENNDFSLLLLLLLPSKWRFSCFVGLKYTFYDHVHAQTHTPIHPYRRITHVGRTCVCWLHISFPSTIRFALDQGEVWGLKWAPQRFQLKQQPPLFCYR